MRYTKPTLRISGSAIPPDARFDDSTVDDSMRIRYPQGERSEFRILIKALILRRTWVVQL